jgi:hypothetical protein
MDWLGRTALGLVLMALLAPTAAAHASVEGDYSVVGVAAARSATDTVLAGAAWGPDHGGALWRAEIQHDALGDGAAVTGGTLTMATIDADRTLSRVHADVGAGRVSLVSETAGCGPRVFALDGELANVTVDDEAATDGAYALRVTLRRVMILGRCVVYARTVAGTLTFGG